MFKYIKIVKSIALIIMAIGPVEALKRFLALKNFSVKQKLHLTLDYHPSIYEPFQHDSCRPAARFDSWLTANQPTAQRLDRERELSHEIAQTTGVISVILPTYNPITFLLTAAVESVLDQTYPYFELIIVNDASPTIERGLLEQLCKSDDRIKVYTCTQNLGVSDATNYGVSVATGEYIVFLDHDDLLDASALFEVAKTVRQYPQVDYIYSDSDKVELDGTRHSPEFKPAYCPTLLLSYMYMSHLKCCRRTIYNQLSGFNSDFDGSQDYDFILRLSELTSQITHIPKILYHWRVTPGSTALAASEKPSSLANGLRAVQNAILRRGIRGEAVHPEWARRLDIGIFDIVFPDTGPSVTLLIPSKNNHRLLSQCLASISNTSYRNYRVLIVDNDSDDDQTKAFLGSQAHKVINVPNINGRFNFSHINNIGVDNIETEFVLFLNDDTEVIAPNWLSQMVGYAQIPGVGAVGAKLLYEDNRTQHAGVLARAHNGLPGHAFKGLNQYDGGYLSYTLVTREYVAVTGACMITRVGTFRSLGGFDAVKFGVAYSDVDFCYRLSSIGLSSVFCSSSLLRHREGFSRGFADNPSELANYRRIYSYQPDPYFNPNLSNDNELFSIQPYRSSELSLADITVLFVSHNFNLEGAPLHLFNLVTALSKLGLNAAVVGHQAGPLVQKYLDLGIPCTVCEVNTQQFVASPEDFAYALREEIFKRLEINRADLVFANTLQTYWACIMAAQTNLAYVWNIHESEPASRYFDFLTSDLKALAYNAFKCSYRNIFVSKASLEVWKSFDVNNNCVVVNTAIPESPVLPFSDDMRWAIRSKLGVKNSDIMFLNVGTVCARKNQAEIIEAFSLLSDAQRRHIKLIFVGGHHSDEGQELLNTVENLPENIRRAISFVPETDDVDSYYQCADVFIFSSILESYPLVILEAMKFELPILTTPVYGVTEQVIDGVNAIFYSTGDTAELRDRISMLTDNPTVRAELAGNSRSVLESLPSFNEILCAYQMLIIDAASRDRPSIQSGARQYTPTETGVPRKLT